MNHVSYRWLAIPAIGVAVFAILAADPTGEWETGWGQEDDSPEALAVRRELDAQYATVSSRLNYKESLVLQLIAGESTYEHTISEFMRVNEEHPPVLSLIRARYPGSGDEEKTALNVLYYVRGRAPAGAAGDRVMTRLTREFQARFGHPPTFD